ncbi:MAG: acetyl-CoA carboxylase biotin carboxyl carrier protein [Candidatus Nanopelagicales bacterium]
MRRKEQMSLTPEDIRALVSAFETSGWDELSLQFGETRLDLSRSGRPPQRASGSSNDVSVPRVEAAPPAVASVATAAETTPRSIAQPSPAALPAGHQVTSPSLGLFWRSPQPGAPEFVDVGQVVDAEDTVCIVEVMKLMNHVKAGVSGTVIAINADNGAMVEFGQALVVIDPAH